MSAEKKRPVDLYAHDPDLGIAIVSSNKSGRHVKSWTDHANGYQEIGSKAGANKVLFVLTDKDSQDEDARYALSKGMAVWTEDQLSYFEAVAEAIGPYAKYEIIHSLGLKTTEEKDIHRVLALEIGQPDSASKVRLFIFSLTPERLLKLCVIYRRAQGNADAYQRMLRRNRLPRVRDFVTQPDAILPTDLIVHLGDKVIAEEVKTDDFVTLKNEPLTLSKPAQLVSLNIPMEYASLELIDGQHRLYGFADTDPATKRTFNLIVVGAKGLSIEQRQRTFVSINDNSRRMDANLVAFLKYTTDDSSCQKNPELMAIRIAVELNRTSPFKKAIRLLDVGDQRITLKGLSGYDLKGLIGPKGLLRKQYPANEAAEYVHVLRIYFGHVKTLFRKEWSDPDRYIVATNRGLSAFLKLLKSILKTEQGPISAQVAMKYLKAVKSGWKRWEFTRLQSAYVGSQGWKTFHHRDLVGAVRKTYPDFKE